MKTSLSVVAVLVFVLAAVSGLSGCSQTGPAQAQTGNLPLNLNLSGQQGIWVSGQGKMNVTPDLATLSLGVSVQAARVADAQSQAQGAMDKVMSALTGSGIDKKDIQTQYFNIQQTTRYDNATQRSVVTGYQVSNIVTVKIRALDKVGTTIDAVATAGGDATRVNGLSFSVEQPEKYASQLRQQAMNDAKAKATQLASLAGVTLGKPQYIVENPSSTPTVVPQPRLALQAGAGEVSTSISPGENQITLDVQVAYSIQ